MRESASAFTIPELLFVFERVLETLHRLANGGEIALLSEKHNEDQKFRQISMLISRCFWIGLCYLVKPVWIVFVLGWPRESGHLSAVSQRRG